MPTAHIPSILKHCVLAIYEDASIRGTAKQRFRSALNIAQSRLVEYGFLTNGSETKPADKVVLTTRGLQRERLHAREGPAKNKRFDALYKLVEAEDTRAPRDSANDAATPARKK
jgi:hypothetical protein